uniref:Uncharacterized protein n=1 Tax=Ditylenchus dipsaci TaxID=166011 RepID=A0A915CTB7_9BILA
MLISVAGCRLRLAPATFFSAVGYGRKVPPESMESPLLQPAYSSSLLGKRRFIYMAGVVGCQELKGSATPLATTTPVQSMRLDGCLFFVLCGKQEGRIVDAATSLSPNPVGEERLETVGFFGSLCGTGLWDFPDEQQQEEVLWEDVECCFCLDEQFIGGFPRKEEEEWIQFMCVYSLVFPDLWD